MYQWLVYIISCTVLPEIGRALHLCLSFIIVILSKPPKLFAVCFECGKEYGGKNVGNIINHFQGTAEDCHKLCKETNGCNFFSYLQWSHRNVCKLKATKRKVKNHTKATSGGIADGCKGKSSYVK